MAAEEGTFDGCFLGTPDLMYISYEENVRCVFLSLGGCLCIGHEQNRPNCSCTGFSVHPYLLQDAACGNGCAWSST
jgi:hypothetical protein